MGVYVAERPEGTYVPGTEPSKAEEAARLLLGLIGKYRRGMRARAIREAVMKEINGGEGEPPKRTFFGNILSAIFEPPISDEEEKTYRSIIEQKMKYGEDIGKRLRRIMAGMESPPAELSKNAPYIIGEAEGGLVMTPEGATHKDGVIYSTGGKVIGEYDTGYEPKEDVAEMLRKFYGITREEAARKELDLPIPKSAEEEKRPSYDEIYRNAVKAEVENIKRGGSPEESYKRILREFPTKPTYNLKINLKDIANSYEAEKKRLRSKAIQGLKEAGYPITEENIQKGIEILMRRGE